MKQIIGIILSVVFLCGQASAQTPVHFDGEIPAYLAAGEMGVFATLGSGNLATSANASLFFAGDSVIAGDSILSSILFSSADGMQYLTAKNSLSVAQIEKIEINNTNGLVILDNVEIDSQLVFTRGHLFNPSDTLHIGMYSSIQGHSDSSFIVCQSGGVHIPINLRDSVFVPVGPAESYYMPLILKEAQVLDTVILSYVSTSVTSNFKSVDFSWIISKRSSNNDTISACLLNDSSAVSGGFNFNKSFVSSFDSSINKWVQDTTSTKKDIGGQFAGAFDLVNSGVYNKISIDNPVPVELISFSAEARGEKSVRIVWQTATEINNQHFVLERAADMNGPFTYLNTIPSKAYGGNSFQKLNYLFVDKEVPYSSNVYYKLTQVDFDGTQEKYYTRVLFPISNKVKVYPVPFNDKLNIAGDRVRVSLNIYNAVGVLVYANKELSDKALVIETMAWSDGVYIVSIISKNGTITSQKIIK